MTKMFYWLSAMPLLLMMITASITVIGLSFHQGLNNSPMNSAGMPMWADNISHWLLIAMGLMSALLLPVSLIACLRRKMRADTKALWAMAFFVIGFLAYPLFWHKMVLEGQSCSGSN